MTSGEQRTAIHGATIRAEAGPPSREPRLPSSCAIINIMSTPAPNEAEILARVIAPRTEEMPPAIADLILGFNFPGEDRDRMDALALKAREGTLTGEDKLEIEAYERVGHFLSLLQSKARASLNREPSTSD